MARQRSSDLFPTERPIPASQMIGRTDDVREITAVLSGGSSVVLAGARRTGKTSVCDAVLGQLQAEGLYTIDVDLFRIATVAERGGSFSFSAAIDSRAGVSPSMIADEFSPRGNVAWPAFPMLLSASDAARHSISI